jgi:alginate O-acetyltransferase complex protein AlgI
VDTASSQFVLFGLAVAAISSLSRSSGWKMAVLLAASLIFIGLQTPDPWLLLPLAAFLLLGYGGLQILANGWSGARPLLLASIVFVFIWLKKYTFLPHAIFLDFSYFTLGLSYIFFRVLHLLIETDDKTPKVSFNRYLV